MDTLTYDPKVILNACQCGYNRCVEKECPLHDEDCPAYICKNLLLEIVYELYKLGNIKVNPVVGWIDVKDRLPKETINPVTHDFQEVLCFCNFGGVPKASDIRVYKFGRGHFLHGSQIMDSSVTHWMPFPKEPCDEYEY